MALFKKKPTRANGENGDNSSKKKGQDEPFVPQPEKARRFFEFAKASADSFNFAYALECFAAGLKLDPEAMSAHEAMFEAAVKYMNNGGKAATGKEIKGLDDGTPVGKFVATEFAWMKNLKSPKLAVRILDAAGKFEQKEYGHWIAPRVANLLRSQKKVSKGVLEQTIDMFSAVEAWDEAIAILHMAQELDPSDSALADRLNNLSVQRAMEKGGYDQAGKEGGFREMIRDADKQRELEEQESIAGGESVEQRNLDRARQAYEEKPDVPENINQFAQLLRKQATPEADEQAYQIYMKGFEALGQYRFRMAAGDIRINQLRESLKQVQEESESKPDDPALQQKYDETRSDLLKLRSTEYIERVKKYPTDRLRKFDLGTVEYELGRYDDAMAQFQSAKDEPKLRTRAGHMLGRCFAQEGWHREAVAEFEEAIGTLDGSDPERELDIRYDLMVSLIEHAREEKSIDLAKRALDICSVIARKNIAYRDIRARRKEIDTLTRELAE